MSTEEETTLDENEQSTLNENADTEDTSNDFDDLFNDIEDASNDDDIDSLKEKLARLEKGVKKLATQRGKEKAEPKKETKEVESSIPSYVKRLYFKENPAIETVWDELVKEAGDKDPIEYYESKKGWQLEAKARFDEKRQEEESKSKIDRPSNYAGGSKKFDPMKVKPEEVATLKPSEKAQWLKAQVERERYEDSDR